MTVLSKAIYRINAISIKILTQFFTNLEKTIFRFMWKCMKPMKAKLFMNGKRAARAMIIPDFKLYHRIIVIKPAWYKNRLKTGTLTHEIELKTQT